MGMFLPVTYSMLSFTIYPVAASFNCFPFLFFPPTSNGMPSISKSDILDELTECFSFIHVGKM